MMIRRGAYSSLAAWGCFFNPQRGLFQPTKPVTPAFLSSCSQKQSQKKGPTFQGPTGVGERFVFRPFYLNLPDPTDSIVFSLKVFLLF